MPKNTNIQAQHKDKAVSAALKGFPSYWAKKQKWGRDDIDLSHRLYKDFQRLGAYGRVDNLCEAFDCSEDDLQLFLFKMFIKAKKEAIKKADQDLPPDAQANLALFVRAQRTEMLLSQNDLVRRSSVPLRTIRNIENGKSKNPAIDVVSRLCDTFNCSVGDIENFDRDETCIVTPARLGVYIKAKREERQWAVGRLANQIGYTKKTIQDLESGKTKILRFEALKKICRLFDVTPRQIFEETKPDANRQKEGAFAPR